MTNISSYFLRTAVLAGLIGMAMGMGMGITQDFSLMPAHAHLNLLGWVSMAIYGLFYRNFPGATEGALPRWHFVVAVVALVIMIPALVAIGFGHTIGIPFAGIGGTLMIVGFALFGIVVVRAT